MPRDVKLNRLETVLEEVDYPVSKEGAASSFGNVSLRLADGEVGLAETIDRSHEHTFDSVEELAAEVRSLLPQHAVGEPYQSEGEG